MIKLNTRCGWRASLFAVSMGFKRTRRAINSAGECYLHMVEVEGSNPPLPTKWVQRRSPKQPDNPLWGYSSVGRAMRSQRIGHGFESHYLHHRKTGKTTVKPVFLLLFTGYCPQARRFYDVLTTQKTLPPICPQTIHQNFRQFCTILFTHVRFKGSIRPLHSLPM